MSVLFYPESIRILGSDANGNNVLLCEMAVDDIANLPTANAFISDGYVLSMGCVATAINDNSKHRLNGNGNWVQIAAGTSTYTRAEIDTMQADLQNQIDSIYGAGELIPSNSDLDDFHTNGLYYATNQTSIASFLHCPVTRQFILTVKFGTQSICQIIEPMSKAEIMYKFVRMYTNNSWGDWHKFTAEIVV